MVSNKKAMKSGAIYAVATIINAILVFVTTPYFTREMSKMAYGEYNNYLSWYNILMVISLNLSSTFISARKDYIYEIDSYVLSCSILNTLIVAVFTPIILLINTLFRNLIGISNIGLFLLLCYIVFNQVFTMYQVNERFYFRYKLTSILIIITSIVSVLVSMGLVRIMKDQAFARLIGLSVPIIIVGIITQIILYKRGKKIKIDHWKYAIPICLPYVPHLLSLTILNSLDKTMITNMVGKNATAVYSVAYTCGTMISSIVGIFNNAYVPWLTDRMINNDFDSIKNFSKKYVFLFQIMLIGVLLLGPEIIYILGGPEYADSIDILPAIIIGCGMQLIYTMYVNIEQFYKKTKWMALVSVFSALLNGGLNTLLIPVYGFKVAAYTTLVSYLFLALGHILIVHRLGYGRYYSSEAIFISIFIGIFLAMTCNFIYKNSSIRIILIVLYVIAISAMILNKKHKIKKIIKDIVK